MKTTQRRVAGLPKYIEIAERFRRQIEEGELKPGDRLPSFIEMRDQHGIGQGTLERVHALLDQDGLISREPGRGTFICEPQSRAKTSMIGFCGYGFTLTSTSYWAQIISGIREVVAREEIQLLLLDGESPAGWDKVDGVLMSEWAPELALRWMPGNLPCVSLIVPVAGVQCVLADDEGGVKAATQHLIALGHQRIAYLTGADFPAKGKRNRKRNPISARRESGYRAALREAGIKPNPRWTKRLPLPSSYDEKLVGVGRETMRAWLRDDWSTLGCTAMIAHNDEVAFGIVEALQDAGISVPDELSVVGFDGVDLCEYSRPRLASIKVPLKQIGKTAAESLIRQIKEPQVEAENIILPVTMQPDESIARLATK